MNKKCLLLFLWCLSAAFSALADEGMWLPSLIGRQVDDMKAKGFRLTAEDIYSVNQASLKDAVVLFGRGCTGELVSPEGLLLTNHHCGYGQIQSHSSLQHDYLTDGFWAMSREEELPNPGLTVSFLVRMEDVTDRVLAGVKDDMDETRRQKKIAANIERVKERALKEYKGQKGYEVSVESLYYGNQYFLFLFRTYGDVRLVGAPPSAIGKFGGDTDNWMWPRHTGDFSVFRIYADADNQPADYAPDNVPYRPRHWFPVSTAGMDEGDFTFVYGCPGSTREYVTSDHVARVMASNPNKIRMRTERLDIINAAMAADPAVRIKYASKAANIANAWKKWQGESLGLERLGTLGKKRAYEERFARWAAGQPEYAGVLERLRSAYEAGNGASYAADFYTEGIFSIELMSLANYVTVALEAGEMPVVPGLFYKDYEPEIDRQVACALVREFAEHVPAVFMPDGFAEGFAEAGGVEEYVGRLFDRSALADSARLAALTVLPRKEAVAALTADPAVEFYAMFADTYRQRISPVLEEADRTLAREYRTYMRGQMEFEPERHFYPDANLTLRVAYGAVEGYNPEDGVRHLPVTTLEGIIAKDNPDIYDYDVPDALRRCYEEKDYGRWAVNVGTEEEPYYTVPVAFLATNHTTGGNSGSPVLNGDGELVGINFDRTWLSTMSDLEFDPAMCRNISVDIRYVLFVIEKIGGAGYLIDEMTLR